VLFLRRGTDILSSFILSAAGNCPCRLSLRSPCRVPLGWQPLASPCACPGRRMCLKAVLYESKRRVVHACSNILVSRVCCCHFPAAWLPPGSKSNEETPEGAGGMAALGGGGSLDIWGSLRSSQFMTANSICVVCTVCHKLNVTLPVEHAAQTIASGTILSENLILSEDDWQ